jgi:hypothetical protein
VLIVGLPSSSLCVFSCNLSLFTYIKNKRKKKGKKKKQPKEETSTEVGVVG